ncbi:MAG: EAL domain-containing protein [Myxococcales bacterium]|nr:EAL domain-containing protein [Myxococcales bacterium]
MKRASSCCTVISVGRSRRGITQDLLPHVEKLLGVSKLHVAYQPIVDVTSGEVYAFEALLRSTDTRFPGPAALVSRTIELNVCGELGRLVRGMAIENCRSHALFLNVHPREFEDGWMVRPDDPIFQHEHPVYLEITESVPLSHEAYCHSTLKEVRAKGVRLAVDDLGAGFSNLLYIAQLAPEVVKLDRELTRSTTHDARSRRLFRGVVNLCTDMGAKVVAEGVETREELDAVIEAGAHYVQGFFVARPTFEPEVPKGLAAVLQGSRSTEAAIQTA